MAAIDVVNRLLREFKRYTGDGLPNEPVGAPLPVGDPASGPHNPKKAELRSALLAPLDELDGKVEAAEIQVGYAEEWAQSDDPISEAAGGDGSTDRSAKYWAGQAEEIAIPNGSITAAKITDDSGEQEAIKEKLGLGSVTDGLLIDQRVLGLLQSEFEGVPIFLGGGGSALHDGFVTLDYVAVGSAINLDTSEESVLKPTSTIDSDSSSAADGTIVGNFDGTTFTRAFSLDNGKTVARLGLYATTAATYHLKICRRNSPTSIDIVVSEAFAHAGGGWQDFELSSPYEVPASGTFHLGMYAPGIDDVPANEATDRIGGFGVGANVGVGTGITTSESTGATTVMRAIYSIDFDDLTVASVPVESVGVPSTISLVALLTGDEVINSDAVFSVSRDEGANWSVATMTEMYLQPGNVRVMRSNEVDVSGQPSSSHVQWRLVTSNDANVELLAVAVWGDA